MEGADGYRHWLVSALPLRAGMLGPGKQIDSAPLPMDQWGELSFREALLDAISRRAGIGDALAEGCCRAAQKWGRLETGHGKRRPASSRLGSYQPLDLPSVEWAYAYMLGAGDPTWHGLVAPAGAPRDGTPLRNLWRSCPRRRSRTTAISSCSTMHGRAKRPGRPASIPRIKPRKWPGAATIRRSGMSPWPSARCSSLN